MMIFIFLGISSGYDSGDICDSESDVEPTHPARYDIESDTDEYIGSDNDYDSDSDSDTEDDGVIRYTDTTSLCDSLKYILSLPELCDVTFHVGPKKIPIHGVKAILGTRSRCVFNVLVSFIVLINRHLSISQFMHF